MTEDDAEKGQRMTRFWIAVTVMVPIETDHPSPVKAENDAMRPEIVSRKLQEGKAHVSHAHYSRQEPAR